MKIKDLIVIGAGNPDIVRLIEDINDFKKTYNFLGFLEKDKKLIGNLRFGYPVLGNDDLLKKKKYENVKIINNVFKSIEARKSVLNNLKHLPNLKYTNLIHPTAHLNIENIGYDNIIYDNVIIQAGAIIGNHNIIHTGSIIGHETQIGNCCLIAATASVGSRVKIASNSFLGLGCVIISGGTVEEYGFVGVGSVVTKKVKSHTTVLGNPARVILFKTK